MSYAKAKEYRAMAIDKAAFEKKLELLRKSLGDTTKISHECAMVALEHFDDNNDWRRIAQVDEALPPNWAHSFKMWVKDMAPKLTWSVRGGWKFNKEGGPAKLEKARANPFYSYKVEDNAPPQLREINSPDEVDKQIVRLLQRLENPDKVHLSETAQQRLRTIERTLSNLGISLPKAENENEKEDQPAVRRSERVSKEPQATAA